MTDRATAAGRANRLPRYPTLADFQNPRDGDHALFSDDTLPLGAGLYIYNDRDGASEWRLMMTWEDVQEAIAEGRLLQGLYDQTLDQIEPGGGNLPAASSFGNGDYFTLSVTGTFVTPITELNGKTGTTGGQILAYEGEWYLLDTAAQDFLSKQVDDSAGGVITFNGGAKNALAPLAAEDLTRKDYVDNGDAPAAAHIPRTDNPHSVTHEQLPDKGGNTHLQIDQHIADGNIHHTNHNELAQREAANAHPTSAITGLDAAQSAQDAATAQVQANLTAHEGAADPHTQYVLNDEGLATWVLAGYGGILMNTPTAQPNIDATWETLVGFDGGSIASPLRVTQDFGNDGILFDREGIWQVNIKVTLEHNEANGGRRMLLRFFNQTTGSPGSSLFVFGTGRNQGVTNLTVPGAIFEVAPSAVGQLVVLQLSSATDTYSSVSCIGASMEVNHVGEATALEA